MKASKGRFTGSILGFAIGDALGMPAQFLTPGQIQRYYGKPISDFVRAHAGHASEFLSAGSYTDDTQMLLATAECLLECRKVDPARQADALLSWYLNTVPHRTPMRANLRACKHLSTGRACIPPRFSPPSMQATRPIPSRRSRAPSSAPSQAWSLSRNPGEPGSRTPISWRQLAKGWLLWGQDARGRASREKPTRSTWSG